MFLAFGEISSAGAKGRGVEEGAETLAWLWKDIWEYKIYEGRSIDELVDKRQKIYEIVDMRAGRL